MTLPTPTVLLDDGTGTFPINITSKVLALDGYEISRGRDDWQGAVTAGELGLLLNNSDGRFTPGSTILDTPSPITVDQRIRVRETINGVTYNRFTGYVKSWPISWPGVVPTFATVQITATDAQARAERRPLRPMIVEEILLASPAAYYTLTEPEGSSAAGDTSGNQTPVLTSQGTGSAVAFGQGTGPVDGLSAARFFGGQYLAETANVGTATSTFGLGAIFATSTTPVTFGTTIASGGGASLTVTTGGLIQATGPFVPMSGPSVVDGDTHVAFIESHDGVTATLWLDGVAVGTTPTIVTTTPSPLVIGGETLFISTPTESSFTGTISHVAVFPSGLPAGSPADISALALGLSETADARIARLASYAGIPTGTLDASTTNVPAQATDGMSVQDAIQEVADAEMGLVFIDGSGNLTFFDRDRVPSKTVPDLTLDSQYITPDVQPVTDDQQIINYFEVSAVGAGAMTVVRDLGSEDTHGRYPVSQTYLVENDYEATSRANWIVTKQAEPTARYGTLTINLYKMTAAQASATLAALDLNGRLRVTSMASQTPGGTVADLVVQGLRESVTAESWTLTANLFPFDFFEAGVWSYAGALWDSAVWAV